MSFPFIPLHINSKDGQLLAYFFPVIFTIPLFGSYLAKEWLWWFTPSLSYVGQGIIMGFPTALSMNLVILSCPLFAHLNSTNLQGMLVGWGVLSPLSKYRGWAPGPVGDMTSGARGWILWTSLAIMVSDSVVSLLPVVQESVVKIFKSLRASENVVRLPRTPITPGFSTVIETHVNQDVNNDFEPEERLVPIRWVLWGLGGSIFLGTALVWFVFGAEGIRPWATIVGFLMGGLLSILG